MRDMFVESQMNQAKFTARDLRLREVIELLRQSHISSRMNDEIAEHLENYRDLLKRVWDSGQDEDKL